MVSNPLRIGIVGCGDVASRHYVPALAELAPEVRIVALMDARLDAAQRAAAAIAGWSAGVDVFDDLEAMLRAGGLDAVIDLAPAPRHEAVNQKILDAGVSLYSEKPIASTVAEADRLIATAVEQGIDVVRGAATPVLTAEHARHVLDIIEAAYASIDDGASHATTTTF